MANGAEQASETLAEWLASQVARGCTFESMIGAMQVAGYSGHDARRHVSNAFATAGVPFKDSDLATAVSSVKTTWHQSKQPSALSGRFKPVIQLQAPRMMTFDNFLSDEECDTLIKLSQTKMRDSRVVDPKTGEFVKHPERTSSGTHFEHQSHATVIAIENRIHELLGFETKCQEAIQILHYPVGGEYRPHYDYFAPDKASSQAILAKGGQRLATVIMYLNTPETGGETDFPKVGLTVTAKKGRAVYFENIDPQGQPNPNTLHAGLPVITGEKWIATKWLRERPLF